jgi:DNA modification methylase
MMKKSLSPRKIKLTDIDVSDRARRDYQGIDDLIQSIKTSGLINPVTLADKDRIGEWKGSEGRSLDPSKRFLLLAGGRRLFAFAKGNLSDEIDARVYDRLLTPEEIKSIELEENLQRVDMTWDEEVRLKKQIHDLQQQIHGKAVRGGGVNKGKGHSVKDTAELLETSEATVIKDLKLAEALEKMPELATAKNKSDAQKMLKQLGKDVLTERRAADVERRRANTPLEAQRKQLYDSYIINDFFEGVKKVPDQSIDIVEIDPPYAIDIIKEKRAHKTVTQDYNEVHANEYLLFMDNTIRESKRVMKQNAWLILWFGPDPWFQPMLDILRKYDFQVRGLPGIWNKGRGQTNQPAIYLGNSYEMFFYGRKGNVGIKKQGRSNVFDFPPVNPDKKIHPTERPIEMIEEVLRTFGDPTANVMVPYVGSGNTLLAASNLGMKAFGYDLSKMYKDRFVVRVDEAQPGTYRSY